MRDAFIALVLKPHHAPAAERGRSEVLKVTDVSTYIERNPVPLAKMRAWFPLLSIFSSTRFVTGRTIV